MKFLITYIFLTLYLLTTGHTQTISTKSLIDSTLAKKITVSGFCLCQTTLTELKNLDSELQEVDVEEMDLCKEGFVQDARFVNRKGFSSKKYPGLIFQKNNNNDFIGKIRLTKDFVGLLPDGTPIDMKTLTAKGVLKIYPKFDTWKSRGCSDYWNLSNDTLSFFVKIDKSKKPQYPVDEAYYSEKPIEGIDLVVSCYSIIEKVNNKYKQLFDDPVFYVDSINVTRVELQQYQPTEIAVVTVYKDTNAIKLIGEQGKYGAVYVETKKFARSKYWNYFKSKSPDYLKNVPTAESDSSVVYILNGNVKAENFEGELSKINDTNFIELSVIDKQTLSKQYGVKDKDLGIIIKVKHTNQIPKK
ncbi:hypothetical protein QTN47_26310 [Danxiaibacter flavus]|uniref:Uncharacterized protein n=1 Tax=Danxiaibacter flavus TaxID=3049108 RepID=A0ABV3ZNG6_9BACT|nr:hypothetical protein QNM32_26310 [Chitinophagaceae bacterium DXS]